MSKEDFKRIGVHQGEAWACVILESSELFWKYWLFKYKLKIAFSICIVARRGPWYIFCRPGCTWNTTRCVIDSFLRDRRHDGSSGGDYAFVSLRELASCIEILPETCFALIYNAASMIFGHCNSVNLGKAMINTDESMMIPESALYAFHGAF